MTLNRGECLEALGRIIDLGFESIDNRDTTNEQNIKWARVIVQTVRATYGLISDSEVEDLSRRLDLLESVRGAP